MLYSEFIENTGCKENDHNYKVYKDLEVMYMNSDISKAEIYEYGKKLVDNSKSPELVKLEEEVKGEIMLAENDIDYYKREAAYRKNIGDKYMWHYCNDQIKRLKSKIAGLRWVLE